MKKSLKIIGIVLGSLLGVVLILNALVIWRTGSQLEDRITAMRDAGDPVTLSDLAQHAIPPEKNAAVFLRRAQADMVAIDHEIDPILARAEDNQLRASDRKAIRSALQAYPRVIPLLEQAAACTDYNSDVDYTAGLQAVRESLISRTQFLRLPARILVARARLLAAEGDREAALRTCIALLRLNRHFEREPTLINYLVTVANRGVAVGTANEILRLGPVPDKVRDELDTELGLDEGLEAYQHALKTERAYEIDGFKDTDLCINWFNRAYFTDDECHMIDVLNEQLAISSRSYADQQASILKSKENHGGVRHALSNLLVPALVKTCAAMHRMQAQVRCLRVLNALQRRGERSSSVELTLADLGLPAEATTDPFNGEPLRLKKGQDGWIIYSVGTNLKDDGGRIADLQDEGLGPVKIGK